MRRARREEDVVVTGIGLLSPLGFGTDVHLAALEKGRCGLTLQADWQQAGLRSRIGGTVEIDSPAEHCGWTRRQLKTMGVPAAQAAIAARSAIADAGLEETALRSLSTACIIGSGVGSMPPIAAGAQLVAKGKSRRVSPFSLLQSMSSAPSAQLTHLFGLRGPSWTIASACASSTHAIGQAADLVANGSVDMALTGGTEELNEIVVASFEALRTALTFETEVPESAVLPFAAERSGLALSGGSAILVLETASAARARGATVYGSIAGWAANSSARDLVQPEESGEAASECMREALEQAGVEAADVGYVNAHGTATQLGDSSEARALHRVFCAEPNVLVGSTKGQTGHLLGAAGAVEAALCLISLRQEMVPGMPHLEHYGIDADLPPLCWVGQRAETVAPKAMLSNSFGFGGTNGCLVFSPAPA